MSVRPLHARRWLLLRIRWENRIARQLKKWGEQLARNAAQLTEKAVRDYRAGADRG